MTLKDKQLFQSTIGDLVQVIKEELGFSSENNKDGEQGKVIPSSKKQHVYGMAGLAQLLGCSIPTAQRIKSSGVLDSAISQNGKIIVVDATLTLDLLRLNNKKWGRK